MLAKKKKKKKEAGQKMKHLTKVTESVGAILRDAFGQCVQNL